VWFFFCLNHLQEVGGLENRQLSLSTARIWELEGLRDQSTEWFSFSFYPQNSLFPHSIMQNSDYKKDKSRKLWLKWGWGFQNPTHWAPDLPTSVVASGLSWKYF
jgi:hypothetical protein